MNVALAAASASALQMAPPRPSELLRGMLTQNPRVESFSVEHILTSVGVDRAEVSLLLLSIPAIVPVPASTALTSLPTGAIACQLASGRKQVRIPRFVLRQSISRKALAVAVHAVLPVLEAAEKVVRPRWSWINHSAARRALGVFILLLALSIAFPLFGFGALHATSIFVMALGMAEQDGLAVLIGVAVGLVSLAMVAASGISARAVRAKAGRWLRKIGQKLGLDVLARFLRRRGYERLAHLLTLEWKSLLLLWEPERRGPRRPAAVGSAPAVTRRPGALARPSTAAVVRRVARPVAPRAA